MSAVTDVLHVLGEVDAPQSVGALVDDSGAEPREVASAIAVLSAQGLVVRCPGGYLLTRLGRRAVGSLRAGSLVAGA